MRRFTQTFLMIFLSLISSWALANGDANAGKTKSASCAACHGKDGNSAAANFPKLAGQNEKYLIKQMMDFKQGSRNDASMEAQVKNLSDQDMADIAAYYSSKAITTGQVSEKYLAQGQQLYRGGNPETGVAACASCHGANGEGVAAAGFAALAGQHEAYLTAQLKAFRAAGRDDLDVKRRNNDAPDANSRGMMQDIAAKMSDKEIRAISSYISGMY